MTGVQTCALPISDAIAHAQPDAIAHAQPDAIAHAQPDAVAHADRHRHGHAQPNTIAHADRHRHGHAHGHRHAHTHGHRHAHADGHRHAHTHGDRHAHSDGHRTTHTDGHRYTNVDGYAPTHTNTHAQPVAPARAQPNAVAYADRHSSTRAGRPAYSGNPRINADARPSHRHGRAISATAKRERRRFVADRAFTLDGPLPARRLVADAGRRGDRDPVSQAAEQLGRFELLAAGLHGDVT